MKDAFHIASNSHLTWLECTKLARIPWLLHAFSTRLDESESDSGNRGGAAQTRDEDLVRGLNLGFILHDQPGHVARNRHRFLEALGAGGFTPAEVHQIHSALIFSVGRDGLSAASNLERRLPRRLAYHPAGATPGSFRAATSGLPCSPGGRATVAEATGEAAVEAKEARRSGDALLTSESGILLSVRTADCLPVLLADPPRRAVAAVHAGWRGALERIIEKAAGEMRRVFGSDPAGLIAALGPSIRACCYEVGQEVVEAFEGRFAESTGFFTKAPPEEAARARRERYPLEFLTMMPPGHGPVLESSVNLDLVAVARHQLLAAGLRAANIAVAPYCTACRTDLFYSHRQEGPLAGRMMAVIGIRE